MSMQSPLALARHNPDVLTCIANLSNDEVFTPPEFANRMLDTLADAWAGSNNGANIWADPKVTFLDPFTKSGVFLREIVSRLTDGLEKWMPDLQSRVDHILTKQVFGIGITELTALLARRSVYCSKWANGPHSIATSFDRDWGNIWFERTEHTWVGRKRERRVEPTAQDEIVIDIPGTGRCEYCGASEAAYSRESGLESHAYAFIHTDDIKARITELFGDSMQFDVIIGNPPYQLNDGGGSGTSAGPLYHLFVTQAKYLEPKYLSMVTPARWFSGGKGLDEFRGSMLEDDRLRVIDDYPDSNDVFPGTQIKGGIAYWLWARDNPGEVTVTTYDKGAAISTATRPLLEKGSDVFIRYNEALPILRKVAGFENAAKGDSLFPPQGRRFAELVSVRRPFGLPSTFRGEKLGEIIVYQAGSQSRTSRRHITRASELIDQWKVFIPFLASGSDSFPHSILGRPFVGAPGTAATETYLAIGPFEDEKECLNVISYISTRLFRFMVLQKKPSQNATKKVYEFVPTQDFSKPWSDEELYAKYNIVKEEVAFIESMVRPMDSTDA
ncbi:Eco57I restriction-modification methylase domain-containing protein [Humibacter ginsenosidimutans]|uniref:site-specific DNA-methyltransferase (adenine-specific) n=1 Tax=Humibacter ginsenosidimutans TaxID=2599293 RepID=A0A5B8M3B3_9MICO|nr:Eco57I restriction-modification methylase domain-containing protein [Humibacter ginsenosidimutans]QDZ15288.1 restriction endonuclease [Humibacter ginsenosidimutans]